MSCSPVAFCDKSLSSQNIPIQKHHPHELFECYQGYELVVCGHSLGGGTAVLLATILRPKYPGVRCFSYSPPGGLLRSVVLMYQKFHTR